MLKNKYIFPTLAILTFALVVAKPGACGIKMELPGEVEVGGQSIFLSDLLPSKAPAGIRQQAQAVLIGASPQPGSIRVLDRSVVASLIGTEMAGQLDIPQQIVVRRATRHITREEVVAAIRTALGRNGFSDPGLQPDDLRVFPSTMISSGNARLEVRRMDFDDSLNEARFVMAERGSLPFLVTADLQNGLPVRASDSDVPPGNKPTLDEVRPKAASAGSTATPQRSRPEDSAMVHSARFVTSSDFPGDAQGNSAPLVQPGKIARLLVTSGEMQMLLDVNPLERGALNQIVRVKLPGTGKVLQARVTGERRLEAIF
jgi:hypothetical protein